MAFDTSPITFPGLGIEINPTDGFYIGNFEIKWYAVIIACGILLATIYAMHRAKDFGLTSDNVLDMLLVGLPCAIVGARAYYVIFEWDQFFGEGIPWYQCFNLRTGGLAIYGAVIGAVIGVSVFVAIKKNKRRQLLPLLDVTGLGLLIGQSIGRWGNFFNREAHGGVTDCFLRMGLIENGQQIYVHPTFLYESVWNLIGLILLHFLSKKRKFDGETFLQYIAWYGLGRTFIEGLRTDSLWIGPFRVSQLLAAASFIAAIGVLLFIRLKKKPDPAKMLVNRVAAEAQQAQENDLKQEEQ